MEDLDEIEARYPDDDPIDLDVRALIAELRQTKLQNRELEERLTKQRAAFAESSTDRERELDRLNVDLKNRMLAVCDAVDGFLAEEVVTKLVGPERVAIWKKAKADFHRDFEIKRNQETPFTDAELKKLQDSPFKGPDTPYPPQVRG